MGKTKFTEKTYGTVKKLKPIDDIFFYFLASDKLFCQEILRVILGKDDLIVKESHTQLCLRNVRGRGVIVDVLCIDSNNTHYNIEIQKGRRGKDERRVRYNASNIDTYITRKGTPFDEIPNVYVIYISNYDVFKRNKTIYHVKRILEETGEQLDNGLREVYVNTKVDDNSDITALMKILRSRKIPNDKRFPETCRVVKHFKEGKGRNKMCNVVEKYAKEVSEKAVKETAEKVAKETAEKVAKETHQKTTKDIATKLLKEGVSDALILKATKLSASELEEIKAQLAKAEIS